MPRTLIARERTCEETNAYENSPTPYLVVFVVVHISSGSTTALHALPNSHEPLSRYHEKFENTNIGCVLPHKCHPYGSLSLRAEQRCRWLRRAAVDCRQRRRCCAGHVLVRTVHSSRPDPICFHEFSEYVLSKYLHFTLFSR